jgi:hypothetical protein
MTSYELRSTLSAMRDLVCHAGTDLARRDQADRAFRQLYRSLAESGAELTFALEEELRQALLTLVGNDDWAAACEHLERARRLLDAEPPPA